MKKYPVTASSSHQKRLDIGDCSSIISEEWAIWNDKDDVPLQTLKRKNSILLLTTNPVPHVA